MKQLFLAVLLILFSCSMFSVKAEQTNVNEVTDLFDKNIENKDALLKEMQQQNAAAADNIKSREHHDAIEGIDQADEEAQEVNSISTTELDNAGRQKRSSKEYQFYDENELEPNYTKPGNKMHKLDADEIVSTTKKDMLELGKDLIDQLKAMLDCKTIKGPVEKEPTHYIKIKREEVQNTVYDQFFCEEPRNQYSCNDSVSLTCMKTGKKYGQWQDRRIRFNGHMLHNQKMNWGWAIQWKRKRWGWHIHSHHPQGGWWGGPSESPWKNDPGAIIADARGYIASHLGVSIEQIGEHVEFPAAGRGVGNIGGVGCRWRVVWDEYEFGYKFREAHNICVEWSEDWTERCGLK